MLNRSPGVHSAGCWLSLLHLISIFSGPQFIRASRGPLRPGVAFLTTSRLQLRPFFNSTGCRTQLSYIIVRRPLDLLNRMFNRHQAEITVMQFRGHSLPVHQSMRVPWEFFSSSHFISQFPPTRFPFITAIRTCHLLPVHHLGMAFLAGSQGQNITHARRRHVHVQCIGGRLKEVWPRGRFRPDGRRKKKGVHWRFFLLFLCVQLSCLRPSCILHIRAFCAKKEKKRSRLYFYLSVLSSLSAVQ